MGSIFLLIGLFMLGGGVMSHIAFTNFEKSAKETEAVITNIDTSRRHSQGETKTEHTVYVSYEVDGQQYHEQLNYYTSSMRVGQRIKLLYNPDDPNDITTGNNILTYVLCTIGGVFTLIGAFFLFGFFRSRAKMKKLYNTGRHIIGTVTDVKPQLHVTVNGRHPLYVECAAEDPATGETMLFASKGINNDRLQETLGMPVDIYYDPQNPKSNFVDTDALLAQLITTNANSVRDYR